MRSAIFSLLPLVGFAVAESACNRKTITQTKYEEPTPAPVVAKEKTVPKSSVCSRSTVTTTKVEKVTITVEPGQEPIETVDVTRTSTLYLTTTITVRPSGRLYASNPAVPISSIVASNSTFGSATSSTSALPDFTFVNSVKPTARSSITKTPYASKSSASPSVLPTNPAAFSSPSNTPKAQGATKGVRTSATGSNQGEATFYGGNVAGGMCSFTGYTIPSNLFGTALSDSNWSTAQACGQCVMVTGPSGAQVTAMVVDQCPGCGSNHLDLFPDAFEKLADKSKGVIKVSWDFVPCGITSPIILKNKEGTSKSWFSMQVMNANIGVSKLEVSADGGATWKATTRQPYNYFENTSGFGKDSVDVKVTSIDGKSIIIKDVSIAANSKKTASTNF